MIKYVKDRPIWVQLLLTIAIALGLVWTGAIVWQDQGNRQAAVTQAADFSLSMHDATMAGLTAMMVTGTVGQRAIFLDQVRQLNNIRDLRVLRGEGVKKLFGAGTVADAQDPDALERQVLETGREVIRVEHDAQGEYLRAVRPALASRNYLGKDCVACHRVDEGVVLGVVSMKMSLEPSNLAIARQRSSSILIALVTCIPVLLIIYPFIRSVVTRPLARAVETARNIARGDLTREIEVESGNEIGHLQQAQKEMRDSLVALVGRVRSGTDAVAMASSKIAAGNADLSARTVTQSDSLRETAQSMVALTHAAQRNADSAGQANQLAISASEVAVAGGKVVSGVVTAMDSISASSRKISDIISVIDGIAFQTNILALNAAVEASRAGEHGRGFAVVASEVRSLAQRSATAASEIKTLIGATVNQVGGATQLVHKAGGTMTEIVQSVGRVTDIMGEINTASLQQIEGIRQANSSMVHVDAVTQQNATLVDEASAATRSLEEQAMHLEEVVRVFKLATAGGSR